MQSGPSNTPLEQFKQIENAYQRNMFASGNNLIDVLALYKSFSDLDIINEREENLYHLAARYTDTEGIVFLKNSGLKPGTDKYGNTPLHALTTTKFDFGDPNLEVKAEKISNTARALVDLGVNPKKKNDSGKAAYVDAALLYIYPFLEVMGDAGIKMDAVLEEGKNLLHTICDKLVHRKGLNGAVEASVATVHILVEKGGIDLEDKDIFDTTPLTYAQRSGVKEVAALMSGNEEDVATGGMTIHEAVLNRDTTAVEALIKAGVDLDDFSDQYHRTPLMLACEYPSEPMVQLLTEGGAVVNFRAGNGESAVLYLLSKAVSNFGRGMSSDLKDLVLMLKTLIKKGLDLDASINDEGDTALNIICQAGYLADLNKKLAEVLVDEGCDVNKPNKSGETPLMSFAARGNEIKYDVAALLIDNNADTTCVDKSGNTALIYAAMNSDKMSGKKIVSLILDKEKLSIMRINNAGQSALDIAVNNDNEAVVKLLLDAGS